MPPDAAMPYQPGRHQANRGDHRRQRSLADLADVAEADPPKRSSRRMRRYAGEVTRVVIGSVVALLCTLPMRLWKSSTEQQETRRDVKDIKESYVPLEVHKVRWDAADARAVEMQRQLDDVAKRVDTVRGEQQQGFRDLSRQIFDLANGKAPQQARGH
jgi:hypothetical protein